MRILLSCLCLLLVAPLQAQTTQYPPIPVGMRVQVGSGGVLPRNTPSLSGTCGTPPHACTQADAVPPNTYGVIQSDPFVSDPGGWYWERVVFDNGQSGWTTAYPPYLNQLSPPQMVQGVSVTVVGDYNGPVLTSATCINDGLPSGAQLFLQPTTGGQMGTIQCAWGMPAVGGHKGVIRAINSAGQADSSEFQFAVTAAPIPQPPAAPQNLRIAPQGGVGAFGVEAPSSPSPAAKPPTPIKK